MLRLRSKWPFTRLVSYSFPTDASPTVVDPFVTATNITAGAGINTFEPANNPIPLYNTTPVLRITPVAAGTSAAAAVANNVYFQFTVSAVSGVFIPISLTFNTAKGGTSSPRGYVVRSDYDSYAADLATTDLTTVRPTWTAVAIPLIMDAVASIAFRIYTYTPTTGASIEYDDIVLCGRPL